MESPRINQTHSDFPPTLPLSPTHQLNSLNPSVTCLVIPPRIINQPHPYNWFPLNPHHHLSNSLRGIHLAPNQAHIEIQPQGTTVEMRGNQILATTLTPYPLLSQVDVLVLYPLNLETGNANYFSLTLSFSHHHHLPITLSPTLIQ